MDAQYPFQKIFLYPEFQFLILHLEASRRISYMMPILKTLESQMKEFLTIKSLPSGLYAVKIDKYEGINLSIVTVDIM